MRRAGVKGLLLVVGLLAALQLGAAAHAPRQELGVPGRRLLQGTAAAAADTANGCKKDTHKEIKCTADTCFDVCSTTCQDSVARKEALGEIWTSDPANYAAGDVQCCNCNLSKQPGSVPVPSPAEGGASPKPSPQAGTPASPAKAPTATPSPASKSPSGAKSPAPAAAKVPSPSAKVPAAVKPVPSPASEPDVPPPEPEQPPAAEPPAPEKEAVDAAAEASSSGSGGGGNGVNPEVVAGVIGGIVVACLLAALGVVVVHALGAKRRQRKAAEAAYQKQRLDRQRSETANRARLSQQYPGTNRPTAEGLEEARSARRDGDGLQPPSPAGALSDDSRLVDPFGASSASVDGMTARSSSSRGLKSMFSKKG